MDLEKSIFKHQSAFLEVLSKQGKSFNTLKNYKTDLSCFNHFLRDLNPNLAEFGAPLVEEYGAHLENKYNSNNSRRRRVQTLRAFCDYLILKGILKSNPVKGLIPSPKFHDIPKPCKLTDIKALWGHLIKESQAEKPLPRLIGKRNQMVFLLIYGGGLKVSDMEFLKNEDIIPGDIPRVLVRPLKRDPYSIPLPPVFQSVFASYLKDLMIYKDAHKLEFNQLLFNANPYKIISGGLSPRGLEKTFEEFKNKLGIEITPKNLRQSCIFKWLHQEHGEDLIKEWMGVAPSYAIKPYLDLMEKNYFEEEFLDDFLTIH
jgi:site-specific recombinase XerD